MKRALLVLVVISLSAIDVASIASTQEHQSAEQLAAAFGRLPDYASPRLSPDGRKLAALRPAGKTLNLTVIDFGARTNQVVLAGNPDQYVFNWCQWANNERIVCSVRAYIEAVTRNPGYYIPGDSRTTVSRLFAVNADGSNFLKLVPEAVNTVTSAKKGWQRNSQVQDRVVSWLPDDNKHILLQLDRREILKPDVYRLNIYSNRLRIHAKHRGGFQEWIADTSGKVRAGGRVLAFERFEGEYRSSPKAKWTKITYPLLLETPPPTIIGFDPDDDTTYIAARAGDDQYSIYPLQLSTMQRGDALWTAQTEHDLSTVRLLRNTDKLLGITIKTDRHRTFAVDEGFAADLSALEQALPNRDLAVLDLDDAGNRLLLSVAQSSAPPEFYLFDRGNKQLVPLGSTYPLVQLDTLGERRLVHYAARDGMRIPAYLTLPPAQAEAAQTQSLPTIVMPHGGPVSRDYASFDFIAQYFAALGYAVLQPQFRGSSGFGLAHERAGRRQWGRAIHKDIMAGIDWLIDQSVADEDRVCVWGASFGGYAALVAAYKDAERIRCAVSFAGVSSIPKLVTDRRRYFQGEAAMQYLLVDLANWDGQVANSPLEQVQKFGVPLLLIHGDDDRQVLLEQTTLLVDRLEQAKKPYEYIFQAGGDHNLSREDHRIQVLRESARFIAQHMRHGT